VAPLVVVALVLAGTLRAQPHSASVDPAGLARRVVLGAPINTQYHEVAPLVSPDGRTLYFHRFSFPGNTGGADGGEDVWVSVMGSNGEWGVPVNMGAPLNTIGNNFVSSVSPDGSTLLLGNAYHSDGSMTGGVSVSYRTADGWSTPIPLRIQKYRNTSPYSFFALSPDGMAMIIEIDNNESVGLDDLYVCFRNPDNTWTRPANLGKDINTPGHEITPYIASDGRTLYFSTDGRGGLGDQDVFMTRRLDDTWRSWTTPVNLGPSVNSPAWDAYFTLPAVGPFAYLVNYIDSRTNSDIVRVEVPAEFRPMPTVVVSGMTFDMTDGRALGGQVEYEVSTNRSMSGVVRSDTATGTFALVLPPGHEYSLHADHEGYLSLAEYIDLRVVSGSAEVRRDVGMVPIRAGVMFSPATVFFDFGKSHLREVATAELDRIAAMLLRHPDLGLEILGHTDSVGTDDYNYRLSLDRARAVSLHLISRGIDSSRITPIGYGRSRPQSPNSSSSGRQLNRRVEFTLRAD